MMKFVGTSKKFSELWKLFKILLVLLQGQAQIQCQQKSACGKSTYNNFNYSTYYPSLHGVS